MSPAELVRMKIAFLCSNLESGKDGVGDYARRMASELIRQGHPSMVVALNDQYISKTEGGTQSCDDTEVPVLRIPRASEWSERIREIRERLDAFQPDWISFQFVTFSYHQKGICAGLGKKLAAINSKAAWHVMFHELWVGLGEQPTFKHRVLGALQKFFIRDMVSTLRPKVVHTQTDPYREVLNHEKIPASVLPLISNVPYTEGDGWADLLEPMVAGALSRHPDRKKLYLAGVFGAVHPEWNAKQAVDILLPLVQQAQKRLVLVFLGRSKLSLVALEELKSALKDRVTVIEVGEKSVTQISKVLQSLDLGLATSPRQAIQKSGSVMAMLEHGLPVLVTRDDWRVRGVETPSEETGSRLLSPKQFSLLNTLPGREPGFPVEGSLGKVARQMLTALQPTQSCPG